MSSVRARTSARPTRVEALVSVSLTNQEVSRFKAISAIPPATFEHEVVKPKASAARLAHPAGARYAYRTAW